MESSTLRDKIIGCWIGKSIGGTLGAPVEGHLNPPPRYFYDPIPDRMMPNDDLDLQVLWLEELERSGFPVSCRKLADRWLESVHFHPDEYGIAIRNITRGLYPPFSGSFDNPFRNGMGAAIRTELWACLAPGNPDLAVRLATEDACVDHVDDGLYAAQFLAALESLAFVESNRNTLLDSALSYIPADSRVRRAIGLVRARWAEGADAAAIRADVLKHFATDNWTDVAVNLAFIVLGWLAGRGDFGASICAAVNCGYDADCTGATLGALLGILDPGSIPAKWLEPIGRDIVLSPSICGAHPPASIDEMSDRILALRTSALAPAFQSAMPDAGCAVVADEPCRIVLRHPPERVFFPGTPATIRIRLSDAIPSLARRGTLELQLPDSWSLGPDGDRTQTAAWDLDRPDDLTFTLLPPDEPAVVPYRTMMHLTLRTDGGVWNHLVGLPMATPSRVNGRPTWTAGQDIVLDAAGAEVEYRVKVPNLGVYRIVWNATRPIQATLDGEPLLDNDSGRFVPAQHRSTGAWADRTLKPGWHDLRAVFPAGEPGGTAYLSIGDGPSWRLHADVEWAMPAV